MTLEEEKEVIRVCGSDYEESDIPAYMRQRKEKVTLATLWAKIKEEKDKLDKLLID